MRQKSAFDYFRATRAYLEAHGKPVAFYSDKHGIFRVNAKDAVGGDRITQFGRALMDLNIDIICANSPQAKGRIERAFGTLQDRMVKELRLAGISTVAAANAWLPGFIAGYNARFGRQPANAKDLHRPLTAADHLDEILTWREVRTVTNNLTLHYDRMMLLLDPTPFARGLARKKVDVVNYPDGRFTVQFEGTPLPFRVFDKIQTVTPGAIVENKRLGAALAMVKEHQASYTPNQRRYDPARGRPPNNLEAPGLRPGCCRAGLITSIVKRYVTEKDDVPRPFTRRRERVEQRRTAGALPRPSQAGASCCCAIAQAGRSPAPATTLARRGYRIAGASGRLRRLV